MLDLPTIKTDFLFENSQDFNQTTYARPQHPIVFIHKSTEISASEDLNALEKAPPQIMPLGILSGKGAVQIMPFWKLGRKFHFFLWFCTCKRSETYIYIYIYIYQHNSMVNNTCQLNLHEMLYKIDNCNVNNLGDARN